MIAPEVAEVERAIDAAFEAHPFFGRPYPSAMWHLLAAVEVATFRAAQAQHEQGGRRPHTDGAVDRYLRAAWPAAHTLYRRAAQARPGGGAAAVPAHADLLLGEALDALETAVAYDTCETVFPLVRRGVIGAERHGRVVVPQLPADVPRYRVYNALAQDETDPGGIEYPPEIAASVDPPLEAWYAVARRLAPLLVPLPRAWSLGAYTTGDFADVWAGLLALALRQHRRYAAELERLGTPVVLSQARLAASVAGPSGVPDRTVRAVLDDLTYGRHIRKKPDPALQPLVPLAGDLVAFAPAFVLYGNADRNFVYLVNLIPERREAYSRVSGGKEAVQREGFLARARDGLSGLLAARSFDFGDELGDVDLALVDGRSRRALLVEFKWFGEPSSPHEAANREEELHAGVQQTRRRLADAARPGSRLRHRLGIPATYDVAGVVASDAWVGYRPPPPGLGLGESPGSPHRFTDAEVGRWGEHPVPVVRAAHLAAHLRRWGLPATMRWLAGGHYLPREGRDFLTLRYQAFVGKWGVEWYGLQLAGRASPIAEDLHSLPPPWSARLRYGLDCVARSSGPRALAAAVLDAGAVWLAHRRAGGGGEP